MSKSKGNRPVERESQAHKKILSKSSKKTEIVELRGGVTIGVSRIERSKRLRELRNLSKLLLSRRSRAKYAASIFSVLGSPLTLISASQAGLPFESFLSIASQSPFTLTDWASFLHLTEKKLLSLQKGNKPLSQAQSEIILQIAQLQKLGVEILGGQEQFAIWASAPSLALEGKSPKDFMSSTFGIQMLTTELHRIEYGILA